MKRHILAMINIENSVDGEDAEETQRLLQAQEQTHRATQRFHNNIFYTLHKRMKYLYPFTNNVENLTYLLSWGNSDGF